MEKVKDIIKDLEKKYRKRADDFMEVFLKENPAQVHSDVLESQVLHDERVRKITYDLCMEAFERVLGVVSIEFYGKPKKEKTDAQVSKYAKMARDRMQSFEDNFNNYPFASAKQISQIIDVIMKEAGKRAKEENKEF